MFGFEHVIPALWMSPLSDPMRMLAVALAWGIGFILLPPLAIGFALIRRVPAGASAFNSGAGAPCS